MARLIEEKLTGQTAEIFWSEAMVRGTELEPRARNAYSASTGHSVREVGMAFLDNKKRVGASPDGLIGSDGGLEIKCPLPHTHEKYLIAGRPPSQYMAQIQGNLWITGRKWWDFVSFAPEFEPAERMMLCRVPRDEDYITRLASEVARFVEELDEIITSHVQKRACS